MLSQIFHPLLGPDYLQILSVLLFALSMNFLSHFLKARQRKVEKDEYCDGEANERWMEENKGKERDVERMLPNVTAEKVRGSGERES